MILLETDGKADQSQQAADAKDWKEYYEEEVSMRSNRHGKIGNIVPASGFVTGIDKCVVHVAAPADDWRGAVVFFDRKCCCEILEEASYLYPIFGRKKIKAPYFFLMNTLSSEQSVCSPREQLPGQY